MRKIVLSFILLMSLFFVTACQDANDTTTGGLTTEVITTEAPTTLINERIEIVVDDQSFMIEIVEELSLFELMSASTIDFSFFETTYGPMITQIENLHQDQFHWIGLDKNGEPASAGVEDITFGDNDVFEFTLNLATWTHDLEMTFVEKNQSYMIFEFENSLIAFEGLNEDFVVNGDYQVEFNLIDENEDYLIAELVSIEALFDGYIEVVIGDDQFAITYLESEEFSVFELIQNSEIQMTFIDTEWGEMITSIGEFKSDDFHWIGFTINGEFAMEGLSTIDYQHQDIFEFNLGLMYSVSLDAELIEVNETMLIFENENQPFTIYKQDLGENFNDVEWIEGFIYHIEGLVSQTQPIDHNVVLPSIIEIKLIDDFTDLYTIEVGTILILMFTVTDIDTRSIGGYEVFAEDVNGLSSTEISQYMSVPSQTNYIFYTFPSTESVILGETYIGKFIYQVNEPNQIPQLSVYSYNINGDMLEQVIYKVE